MLDKNFDVQSIAIKTAPEKVFDFVAEPGNVARWAKGFSEVDGKSALMETPNGSMKIGLEMFSNKALGTVDTVMTMPDGSIGKAFSRITENDGGTSAIFSFVLLAPPVPLEQVEGTLEQQKVQLAEELQILKGILENEN